MRNPVKYSRAERMSFELQPETCPAIEAAFDAGKQLNYSLLNERFDKIEAERGIKLDRRTRLDILGVLSMQLWDSFHTIQEVVMFQGTFPLRLALVRQIEKELIANGGDAEFSHFEYWINTRKRMDAIHAENAAASH